MLVCVGGMENFIHSHECSYTNAILSQIYRDVDVDVYVSAFPIQSASLCLAQSLYSFRHPRFNLLFERFTTHQFVHDMYTRLQYIPG